MIRSTMSIAILSFLCGILLAPLPAEAKGVQPSKVAPVSIVLRPSDSRGRQVPGPGYFVITAAPGTTTRLYALVGNAGHKDTTIDLGPVDAGSGPYGGISLALPTQRRTGVGSWVTLSATRINTGSGKEEVVTVTVHVPAGTRPGQHLGALTAFIPVRAGHHNGVNLSIQTRVAVGILVTVPGPLQARLSIPGVRARHVPGTYFAIVRILNSGNTLLAGHGYVDMWRIGQRHPVFAIPMTIGEMVPGTTANYPLKLGPRGGRYTYVLRLWWKGGRTATQGSFLARGPVC